MNAHKVVIEQPNTSGTGTTVSIDGTQLKGVRSVEYKISTTEIPEVSIEMITSGVSIDCLATICFDEGTIQSCACILRNALTDNKDLMDAFIMSIRSAIHESEGVESETVMAMRIAKRLLGD